AYFYEAAAARPDRVNLENVRRGRFEGLLRDSVRDTTRRPEVEGPELPGTGRPQVSMNITDFERTPMTKVHTAVTEIAARHGAEIAEGEVIGLIPEAAYEPNADWVRQP